MAQPDACRPDQEAPDLLDGILRRREADAQQGMAAERGETLERQREMAAALVGRDGMDLVDDHGAGGRQHLAARDRAQQRVEGFGGGDDDMRRPAAHALPFAGRRVAGAHPGPDVDVGQAAPAQLFADAGQGRFEIALDVVGERLERRDIDDLRLVPEFARDALPHQIVDRGHESGQGLARAGGGGDQRIAAGLDQRPGVGLRRRGADEAILEPRRDGRMKQRGHWGIIGKYGPRRLRINEDLRGRRDRETFNREQTDFRIRIRTLGRRRPE